jgi:hypothetical protein
MTLPFYMPPSGAAPSDFFLALCQNTSDFWTNAITYSEFTDRNRALWAAIDRQGAAFNDAVLALWRADHPVGGAV